MINYLIIVLAGNYLTHSPKQQVLALALWNLNSNLKQAGTELSQAYDKLKFG